MQIHRLPLVLALKFYGLALVPYIAGAHCPLFYALRRTRMNLEFMRVFTYLFIYFVFCFVFFSFRIRCDPIHFIILFISPSFVSFHFLIVPLGFVAQLGFSIESQWVYFVLFVFNECNSKSTHRPLLAL